MFEVYMTGNLNSFSSFEQYSFPAGFRKSLKNHAPLTILSNTPAWYFLQYHQCYSLQYASHAKHPSTLPTLVHHPFHPGWQVTLARHPHNPRQHVTHTDTSPTLAFRHRKHTTHVSMSPTQEKTPGYPIKLSKLLGLKFQQAIQQFYF